MPDLYTRPLRASVRELLQEGNIDIAEVPVGQYLDRFGAAGPVDKHELEVYVAKELELSVDKIRKEVKSEMTRRGWTMTRPRNQGVGPRRRKWVQG